MGACVHGGRCAAVPQHTGSAWVVLGSGRVERQADVGALDAPEYIAAGGVEAIELPGGSGAVVTMAWRRGRS